jgi:hypothetical protein
MPPHCDTRDGPVVKAAKIALDQHNVNYSPQHNNLNQIR